MVWTVEAERLGRMEDSCAVKDLERYSYTKDSLE